eukprot:scaffold21812_cov110-Isochrysis_galbana.AAC.22
MQMHRMSSQLSTVPKGAAPGTRLFANLKVGQGCAEFGYKGLSARIHRHVELLDTGGSRWQVSVSTAGEVPVIVDQNARPRIVCRPALGRRQRLGSRHEGDRSGPLQLFAVGLLSQHVNLLQELPPGFDWFAPQPHRERGRGHDAQQGAQVGRRPLVLRQAVSVKPPLERVEVVLPRGEVAVPHSFHQPRLLVLIVQYRKAARTAVSAWAERAALPVAVGQEVAQRRIAAHDGGHLCEWLVQARPGVLPHGITFTVHLPHRRKGSLHLFDGPHPACGQELEHKARQPVIDVPPHRLP